MKKFSEIIRNSIITVCILVIVIGLSFIRYSNYKAYKENNAFEEARTEVQEKEKITEETEIEEKTETEETEIIEEEPQVLPEYQDLLKKNGDLYGWIKIEDTKIDYPVMHTPKPKDINFYIHKDIDKNESTRGCIYLDGRCGEDTENLIIYGHNMKDGTMFGSLKKYKEKSYYEEHKYIEFNTLYEKSKYEVVAVSKGIVDYDDKLPEDEYLFYEHINFNSEEEFNAYIDNAKNKAYFETEVTAEYGDKLITLCTCDYWTENARLLVIAKKIS